MKSLDEHLNDAAQNWHKQVAPTLSSTVDAIAPVKAASNVLVIVTSALSIVAITTVLWMSIGSSRQDTLGRTDAMPRGTGNGGVQPTKVVDEVQQSISELDKAQPFEKTSSSSKPSHQPSVSTSSTPNEAARGQLQGTTLVDGFSAEYERLTKRALRFEGTDPLRAASEYRGIGKMCIANKQYAHAIAPLQKAISLSEQNGYEEIRASAKGLLQTASERVSE